MKLQKYLTATLLAVTTLGGMSSCSDDDSLGNAPRLFRPVASLETNKNTVTATWDNIKGATRYDLKLFRVSGTDEAGENIYEECATTSCESSPYTFEDLAWDEKYRVEISCSGGEKSSNVYTTSDVNVPYATKLKSVKTIDNAARITWDEGGSQIKAIVATPIEGEGEPVVKTLSEAQYEEGYVDINGLESNTKYTFSAYHDGEEFSNSTYEGRMTATTTKPIDFDTEYGAGMWLDIRDYPEDLAKDTLKTEEFWAEVKDGMTVILRGDFDYNVSNAQPINKSVRFVTAATLGGNARFISSSALTLAKGVDVNSIEFVNVDFYSDKAIEGGGNEVATNTDKGFGGRQVFNINGVKCTLGSLKFTGCHIEGYRAVARAQGDGDNITNIELDNCVVNGIGDQGVFTTSNKSCDWKEVTMTNCTFTNIYMLCDFRKTTNQLTMNISNCTFCYAPAEVTANANTPLFRFNDNPVVLNVTNTLFGPSMYTAGKGSPIVTNKAGEAGSIFLNGANALVSVSKSFKTNFTWTAIGSGEAAKTYPLDGLLNLSFDETELWSNPAGGEFRIIGNVGEEGIGDPRWLQ